MKTPARGKSKAGIDSIILCFRRIESLDPTKTKKKHSSFSPSRRQEGRKESPARVAASTKKENSLPPFPGAFSPPEAIREVVAG